MIAKAEYSLSVENGLQNLALYAPTIHQLDSDDDDENETEVASLSLLERSLEKQLVVANGLMKGVGDQFMKKNTDELNAVVDKLMALNGGMKDGTDFLDGLDRPDKVSWGTFLKHCEGNLLKEDGVLEDLKPGLLKPGV